MKLHRTQPAVSQAVRRLEESVGERLFDRATKDATLTDAGRLLRDYAERLLRLSEEAEAAVSDLRDLRRGRVLIGANEASVHAVLPLIAAVPRSASRSCTWTCAAFPPARSAPRSRRAASTSAC